MFTVGEKVKIKDLDYLLKHRDDMPGLVGRMFDYAGQETTIKDFVGRNVNWVFLDIDNGVLFWSMDWIEKIDIDNRRLGTL